MIKRVTIKEVAIHAGVSYQTVSKVLNGQGQASKGTEERIWFSVKELGYVPNLIARSLRSQRSQLIGYSWEPTPAGTANPILDQFLQSMVQVAEEASYHLLAFPYQTGDRWIAAYRDLIDTRRVDAFVLSSIDFNDQRIAFLLERNFPFVAFGRSNDGWQFPWVDVDGAAGMRLVVEHLIAMGHRRVGVLAWPETSRVGQNRIEGVYAALKQAGLTLPPELLLRGEGSYAFGNQAVRTWLNLEPEQRPTAIVAFNDIMAVGAMSAIQASGLKVGEEIAVTGFDDSPMVQYLNPALTSISQPVWTVGQQVMRLLLAILDENPPEEMQVLLEPRLMIRASSVRNDTPHLGRRTGS